MASTASASWRVRWSRKKIYDGLRRVFKGFWDRSGLKRSSADVESDVDDWCRVIETTLELRNLLVHGEELVSQRLGDLVVAQPRLGFGYVAGEVLELNLWDIMIVERFRRQGRHSRDDGQVRLDRRGKSRVPPELVEVRRPHGGRGQVFGKRRPSRHQRCLVAALDGEFV